MTTIEGNNRFGLTNVEVAECGGYWKAWGYRKKKLIETDEHRTRQGAVRQLEYRSKKAQKEAIRRVIETTESK